MNLRLASLGLQPALLRGLIVWCVEKPLSTRGRTKAHWGWSASRAVFERMRRGRCSGSGRGDCSTAAREVGSAAERPCGADAAPAGVASKGQHTTRAVTHLRVSVANMDGLLHFSKAIVAPEQAISPAGSMVSNQMAPSAQYPVAPPSDTVVAGSRQRTLEAEQRVCAGETLERAKHAAEIARLKLKLDHLRTAHAAEIERLRTEHGAALRQLVEALWHAQDVARAAIEKPGALPGAALPPAEEAFSRRSFSMHARLSRLVRRD